MLFGFCIEIGELYAGILNLPAKRGIVVYSTVRVPLTPPVVAFTETSTLGSISIGNRWVISNRDFSYLSNFPETLEYQF